MPSLHQRSGTSNASLSRSNTGTALRRGELKISDPIPSGQGESVFASSNTTPPSFLVTGPSVQDGTWPRQTPPASFRVRSGSGGRVDIAKGARVSEGPSLVPSSMSTVPSRTSLTQKKQGGGFRATIKRVFGGKRHRSVSYGDNQKDYHRSEPRNLGFIGERQRASPLPPSLSPEPVDNVAQARALGSHLPHASSDVTHTNRVLTPRRRRRNTIPSVAVSDKDAGRISTLTNSPSRPPRERFTGRDEDVFEDRLKRRSRSADALNEMIGMASGVQPKPARDRAEEIAYWRNSILEKPVPVYGAPPSGADGRVPPRPVGSGQQDRIAPLAPAQTFDFGLESPEGEPVSLEQRVTTLEVKLFDFEYALAKLQGHDIPKPRLPSRPPKRPSIHELFPDSRTTPALTPSSSRETKQTLTRSFSRETNPTSTPSSSREAKPTVTPSSSREVKPTLTPSSSRDQGEPAVPSTDEDEWTFRPQRWSKATSVTIRPPTAQRRPGGRRSGTPSPSSVRLAPDQFDALMALIDQEQSARQQMEMQIMDLRKEVEILRTPVYATIRSAYPTPSPESVHDPGRSTKPKRLHRTPAFQLHKDPHETSRFSMTDPDSEVSDANDGCEDVYETPQETRSISEMARGLPVAGMI